MKLIINGNVKPYYIQMLVMLYFPGEKFPEGESSYDGKSCEISVFSDAEGTRSTVTVTVDGKSAVGESFIPHGKFPEEKEAQFAAGGAFLEACTSLTGHVPPWGMLTGVRPAKLALELLERGYTEEQTAAFFTDVYKTSREKAVLATSAALTSRRIVTPERRKECSVYIAIPFCPTRCSYCSFVSYTSPKLLSMIPDYLSVLTEDIRHTFGMIRELGLRLSSIYIGGGTPTVLNEQQLEMLLSCIGECADTPGEFTLEAGRPDTITEVKLRSAASHGVTRVSVNTQTLNEDVLRSIGRSHSTDDFFRAYDLASGMGFRDINVDLIAGLPGDTFDSFKDSVDRVCALEPSNITVHTFSVKKSAEMKTEGLDVFDREGSIAAESVEYSGKKLLASSYIPYYMYRQKNTVGNLENVGYSKAGHEGLYNIFMMDEIHTVFACGASSVTKLVGADKNGEAVIKRLFEPKYPYEYLRPNNEDREAHRRRLFDTAREFYSSFGIK